MTTDQPRQPPAQPTAPYLEAVTAYGFRKCQLDAVIARLTQG